MILINQIVRFSLSGGGIHTGNVLNCIHGDNIKMFQRGSHLLWQEKYRKIVWRVFVSGMFFFFVKTLANFFLLFF